MACTGGWAHWRSWARDTCSRQTILLTLCSRAGTKRLVRLELTAPSKRRSFLCVPFAHGLSLPPQPLPNRRIRFLPWTRLTHSQYMLSDPDISHQRSSFCSWSPSRPRHHIHFLAAEPSFGPALWRRVAIGRGQPFFVLRSQRTRSSRCPRFIGSRGGCSRCSWLCQLRRRFWASERG